MNGFFQKKKKTDFSPRRSAMLNSGINEAIIVGSYFWEVELPNLLFHAYMDNITNPEIIIHLHRYSVYTGKFLGFDENGFNLLSQHALNKTLIFRTHEFKVVQEFFRKSPEKWLMVVLKLISN